MPVEKENHSHKQEKNWHSFGIGLSWHLFSEYMALKFNYLMEPLTFVSSYFVNAVELVEKSLKMYLAFHEKREDALSHYTSHYGHNIEKLRQQAANFNPVFDEEDVKDFTKAFDDKRGALFQHLRYGSQPNIKGHKANLDEALPIVEKIFFTAVLSLEDMDKKMVNQSSLLSLLITKSPMDQSRNPELLLNAVERNNPYFQEYKRYCETLEKERQRILKAIENSKNLEGKSE